MSELESRDEQLRRHLHPVRGPVHYRRQAEALLSDGASPVSVARILRAVCDPPTPDEGWVVIAGEIVGVGMYWIWGGRLTEAARCEPGGKYASPDGAAPR